MRKLNEKLDDFPNYKFKDYALVEKSVNKIIKKYKAKFNKIKVDFNKFNLKQNKVAYKKTYKLVEKSLLEFVKIFKEFKQHNVVLFLHGSYARNTHELFSDVDFTLCYDNSLRNIFIPIEEIISTSIVDIFDLKYRSKVHPIMNNYKALYPEMEESEITFDFGNKITSYNNDTYKFHSVNKTINSFRDFKKLMEEYKECISVTSAPEYCYTFKQLYCTDYEKDYAKNINLIEKEILGEISRENLLALINVELEKTFKSKKSCILKEQFLAKDFKHMTKILPNKAFYQLLCILRRYLNINFDYKYGINLEMLKNNKIVKLLGEETCKELTNMFYYKNWFISKLEYAFNSEGINFSKANKTLLDKEKCNTIYFKYFGKEISEVFKVLDEFYTLILKTYEDLIKKLKNSKKLIK